MRVGIAFGITVTLLLTGTIVLRADPPATKFIENQCQWPEAIQFVAHVPGGSMQLKAGGFAYLFVDQEQLEALHQQGHDAQETGLMNVHSGVAAQHIVVNFLGSNSTAAAIPFGKQPEYYNYFMGKDPSLWSNHVPAYEGVYYPNFYPGIDLKVYGAGRNIKYDFLVSAGAQPEAIEFEYQGADRVRLMQGDLEVTGSHFTFYEKQPIAFQEINGRRRYVTCRYEVKENRVRFLFPESYDPCYPLVIDPLLIFSTYSGSTADNWGSTATPGEKGTLYSSGVTSHNLGGSFPATPGAFQINYDSLYDVSVLKYDSAGKKLLYASYLGGSGNESSHSLIMSAANELFVLGTTSSTNFPTTAGAIDNSYNGGTADFNVIQYAGSDLFVARISPDGSQLLSGTYLGGSQNDGLNPTGSPLVANYGDQLRGDILVDASGDIFVSTVTASPDFPVTGSFGNSFQGGETDALVLHLDKSLTQIIWAAYLGGNAADASHTIKMDRQGDLYIGGGTTSVNFPSTPGAYQEVHGGGVDGWIAKLAKDGSAILRATFTGTAGFNQVYFLDLDANDNVYTYGQTTGSFPVTSGVYSNANSGQFLQKFNQELSTLQFSTVFGAGRGIPDISPTAFLVNDCNNIYLSGWGGYLNWSRNFWNSSTTGMPTTPDAYQKTTAGSDFYFIVLTGDASRLLYATFLGGNQSPTHVDGGTSRFDKSGIVYHAVCAGCLGGFDDFPTTSGAHSRLNNSINCNNAAFKFDLSTLKARLQTNSVELDMPGLNKICLPDAIAFQNLSTGGQLFEWDFGDGGQLVKQDTTFVMHAYSEPGTYKVRLLAIDAGTCVGRDSTVTTVTVFKPQGVAGPDQDMCFDAGTRLIAAGGVRYEWHNWDQSFTSAEPSPRVNPKEDDGYVVTITDFNGCQVQDTVNIRVIPGIELGFEFSKVYDCDLRPTLRVSNLSDSEETTFFDFGDGATSDQISTDHTYAADGTYPVRIVGVKESCIYDELEQIPIYQLKVPNVITPDEFPENNRFVIQYGNQPLSQSSLRAQVVIYNRWGNKVFGSDNYQDDWNASNVEAGIYYYDIQVPGETSCKGWVQVIK